MKVRLKIAWGNWSAGHVIPEMPGGQARTLIARGIADEVEDEPPPLAGRYADRMMRSRLGERGPGYETR